MKITRFEEIVAWQEARKPAQMIIELTRDLRRFTDPNLIQQMRNCVNSTMANIAEGFDAGSDKEFNRFLKIAFRSVTEFQSHAYFALDSRFLDRAEFEGIQTQAGLTKSQIGGFMRYLNRPKLESPSPLPS